jgi:hypothetical protein
MARKKLITNPDGTLSYPHTFKLGDLVELQDIYKFKAAYGNGFGVITSIDNTRLIVFWQDAQKYMDYTVATATLTLKVV